MQPALSLREERMCHFFTKFHIEGLPRAAVLHRFTEADGGDPHDHPFGFTSVIITGGYVEEVFDPDTGASRMVRHEEGDSFHVPAAHVHRIVELIGPECWTLILPGSWEQKSGFWRFEGGQALHRFHDEAEFQVRTERLAAA